MNLLGGDTCPHCDSTRIDAEFVDVGCGGRGVQATPYECYDCGAREFYSSEDAIDALDVEILAGWHIHPGPDNLSDADRARCSKLYPLNDQQKTACALNRSRASTAREERLREEARTKANADAVRRSQEERARAQQSYLDNALF